MTGTDDSTEKTSHFGSLWTETTAFVKLLFGFVLMGLGAYGLYDMFRLYVLMGKEPAMPMMELLAAMLALFFAFLGVLFVMRGVNDA